MIVMPLSESGVSVHFPDNNYFQFGACASYNRIKGQRVKEMDICWLDVTGGVLWAVELKAFDNPANALHRQSDLSKTDIIDHWINELYHKSLHTLCMLETNRAHTQSCSIAGISDQTAFKLVHLLNLVPGQESYASFIQDKLREMLKPMLAIFRVDALVVIPYNTASGGRLLSWII